MTYGRKRAKKRVPKSELIRDLIQIKEQQRDPISVPHRKSIEKIFVEVLEKYESDEMKVRSA